MNKTKFWTAHRKTLLKRITFLLFSAGLLCFGIFMLWAANLKIPDFKAFENQEMAESTKIYDRTGEVLLYNMGEDVRRTIVPPEEISRNIKNAAVAIEDSEFYHHHGVKPSAILRAFFANLKAGQIVQGGSTITQQVIKNSLLTQDQTPSRKLKEAILALKLEKAFNKDQILGLYLNGSPYGGNIYGIEEASQTFFGKKASDVTLSEAAYLAALPQAPTYFSPYGNHKEALESRKNIVLSRMKELGFITAEEEEAAKKDTVSFLPQNNFTIKAPHFVFYVRQYLEDKYGQEVVERGGLKVITTLDFKMQEKAEEIVKSFSALNEKNYNAHNAGVVGIDPKTGKILVMVGSRDYFEDNNYANYNVTLAKRQPGSSFKPFVYATAFKKGYTPDTVLFDLPTQFQTSCSPVVNEAEKGDCYSPGNYDNKFRGPMTLRDALAQSINIPAIEILYLVGIRDALSTAKDLGISTLGSASRYGLTLVLGGGEVTPLEMTDAYAAFGNDGVYNPYASIERVEDSKGNVLEEWSAAPRRALEPEIARTISDILSDNVARTPGYGTNSPLYFADQDVAIKTGTTNDYKDFWTVGYSPTLALGIWVGNNDNTSMEKRVAGLVVAPMWRKIFDAISVGLPRENFVRPVYAYKNDPNTKPVLRGIWQGGNTYTIDTTTGKLATDLTPPETRKEIAIGDIHSILHWIDKDDPLGPAPAHPENDPQYIFWETPIKIWAASLGATSSSTPPTMSDDVHTEANKPIVTITSPVSGSYTMDSRIMVTYSVTNFKYPIVAAELYLNGEFVGSNSGPGGSFSLTPSSTQSSLGPAEIKVIVRDQVYNRGEAVVPITLSQ